MKIVMTGGRSAWLEDAPDPTPEGEWVVVKTTSAPICGSDMHGYFADGAHPGGHEAVGEVVAVDAARHLGVGDRVFMMENAVYSVISPESCAAIIWRDSSKGELAASALKLTAQDLLRLGLIDGIIPEPGEGAHTDVDQAAENLKRTLRAALAELMALSVEALVEARYQKFRKMGNFFTEVAG